MPYTGVEATQKAAMSLFKLFFSKLGGYLTAGIAFLATWHLYTNEKKKRKASDSRADKAEKNAQLLIKDKLVTTDLEKERAEKERLQSQRMKAQLETIEDIDHESDERSFLNAITRVSNTTNRKS